MRSQDDHETHFRGPQELDGGKGDQCQGQVPCWDCAKHGKREFATRSGDEMICTLLGYSEDV